MQRKKLHSLASLALILLLLASLLSLTSCSGANVTKPILQDSADEIEQVLASTLADKAEELEDDAAYYARTGETVTDESGAPVDMTAYVARLRKTAQELRAMKYDAYVLAIMDDLYAKNYIGTYTPLVELLPDMVDVLAEVGDFTYITDKATGTQALIECHLIVIDDIFASFVDSETAEEEAEMPTSYVGIGVSVTPREDGYIEIISVTEGSPAELAGIAVGDVLIAVDGTDVASIGYNETVNLVRGEAGTSVLLTLKRDGVLYQTTATRAVVKNVTVTHKMLSLGEGKTGYIRISEFSQGTFTEFVAAVTALEAAGATELVFDVRNNPGGHMEAVLGVLEYILPETELPLIRLEYKGATENIYSVEGYLSSAGADSETLAEYAPAKDHEIDMRMAILCNGHTVSASELFTSCLMDFGCAEVFGTTTYGKGLGQRSYRMTDYYAYEEAWGFGGYYTYFEMGYFVIPAFYYSPPVSDNYHEIGVVPHHEVILSEAASDYYIANIPEALDNQLNAAVDFLLGDQPITKPSPDLPDDGGKDDGTSTNTPNTSGGASVTRGWAQIASTILVILFTLLLLAALAIVIAFTAITAVAVWKKRSNRNEK